MQTFSLTLILAALSMVGALGIDTYLPAFPSIVSTFGVDELAVGQTLTVYVLAFAVMMLFHGTVSDSFGRRRVILVSLVIFAIASLGAMFASSIGMLLWMRVLQGAVAGAGAVVGRAIVNDRFDSVHAHKVMAHIMMVFSIAPAVAPVIGGFLQTVSGWRSVFGFLTLVGASLAVACYFWLPETLPMDKRHPFEFKRIAQGYLETALHKRFIVMSLSIAFVFVAIPLYVGSAATFVIDVLHLDARSFAWMFIPIVVGLMGGAWVSSQLALYFSAGRIVSIGFGLMLFAACANVIYNTLFTAAVPWAVLPLFLNAFGLSICNPAMTIATLGLYPRARGRAASLQGFIQMVLFAVISGLVAPLVQHSALHLALVHLSGLLIGIGLWFAVPGHAAAMSREAQRA
jgi:MFS transporter, DHA1 family, multidrug resistance protein